MPPRKFIDLEEAAKMLGVTPDSLNEMRERRKIYGYRDGGNWKFKPEDVERMISERDAEEQDGEFAEIDEDPDSILLSEVELGQSDESTSSTIIGGKQSLKPSPEADIQIARPKDETEIPLDSAIGSETKPGSDIVAGGSGLSPMFDDLDTLDLEMPSAADSGITSAGATMIGSKSPATDDDVVLGADAGGSEIVMGSDALKLEGSGLAFGSEDELSLGEASGDDIADVMAGGSAIDLTGDEDGDLVLGGSSHGDLSRSGDSGINLLNPADSGLSLESPPLELGGSVAESLELGEDDMLLADEPAKPAPTASAKSATPKKAAPAEEQSDDDFLLAPLEEASAEESDSGSQVIALDSEVEFEEAAPGTSGIGAAIESDLGGLLEDDLGEGLGGGLESGALTPAAAAPSLAAAAAAASAPVAGVVATVPDAVFSGWNVASLVLCALLLMFCGMFTFDLLRNMWSWGGAYALNSPLMDMVLNMFGK